MIKISPIQFKQVVKRILKEEVEKSVDGQTINKRLPEVEHADEYKKEVPHKAEKKCKQEILDDIKKIVSTINKDYTVKWDDNDDIRIEAEDLYKVRIIPRWEDCYNIEAYTRNEDRVYITNQNLAQVKTFIKDNLKNTETNVERKYKKSLDNNRVKPIDAPDKGLPQQNKPTAKTVGDKSNKDKNFNEKAVKNDDDLPNKPMKEVNTKNIKLQRDNSVKGVKAPYKYPKQKNNKLTVDWKK